MKIILATDQGEVLGVYPITTDDECEEDGAIIAFGEDNDDLYMGDLTWDIIAHIKNGVK